MADVLEFHRKQLDDLRRLAVAMETFGDEYHYEHRARLVATHLRDAIREWVPHRDSLKRHVDHVGSLAPAIRRHYERVAAECAWLSGQLADVNASVRELRNQRRAFQRLVAKVFGPQEAR